MATFGVSEDGTLSPCRAKPENRGRGKCFHADHRDLTDKESSPERVQAFNESVLAKSYSTFPTTVAVVNEKTGISLSSSEFNAATEEISDAFPQDSWNLLRSFTQEFSSILENEEKLNRSKDEAKLSIEAYLNSDTPMADKIRQYLGPEMNPKTFAALIVNEVRAMSSHIALRNKSGSDSMTRIVLSSVANDMTKKRYLASVLFFAGRCCYCSKTLSKEEGPTQATGEHLTPLTPEKPGAPIGVTRYGNMALACRRCNDDRGNKDLEEWVTGTKTIPQEMKTATLAKIKAFRDFTLYEEYSEEQSQKLISRVQELRDYRSSLPRDRGVHPQDVFDELHARVKSTIFDLREELEA